MYTLRYYGILSFKTFYWTSTAEQDDRKGGKESKKNKNHQIYIQSIRFLNQYCRVTSQIPQHQCDRVGTKQTFVAQLLSPYNNTNNNQSVVYISFQQFYYHTTILYDIENINSISELRKWKVIARVCRICLLIWPL